MIEIKPGSIIRGPNWPEPVAVDKVEEVGGRLHIVGARIPSRVYVNDLISLSDLEKITIETKRELFAEEPWKVFLALEATRYRFASLYDPLLAMNTSKIDPLPHQIDAVYGRVLRFPRIRFLIADDPGAGKTIMAGLIIKELKLRHLIKRILIVAPGHLKDQWRRELAEKFEEHFIVIDRGLIDSLYGENVWHRENQVITSIDFAKREEILPSLAVSNFDLIIVDEAHKMSAQRYGDKLDRTDRYRLGEVLSRVTEHLLFLTATPHRGDSENFRLFLDLLEPGFFSTNAMLQESITEKDNPLFIRRIKEDLKDFEGKPIFLPRHVSTIPFNLSVQSPQEKELYNDLSRYVNTQYNRALTRDKKRNVAFALVILQRRLASSTFALLRSLERRKKRLEDLLKGPPSRDPNSVTLMNPEDTEDLSEQDRWKQEEIWETLSVSQNREELDLEISTVDKLIAAARDIVQGESEIKLRQLKDSLEGLVNKFTDPADKKVLIFTESRDTLEHLERKIRGWGYKVNIIHGGMKLDDRIRAESVFKNDTDILVATEAAGEGINLQFCHLMVNYDLPWNPSRLEQRMGRIHRFGQKKEVYISNLVAQDTREGQVMLKLFAKLDEIRRALGSDKVFDVLSELLYNKSLSQYLVEAAASARSIDEILKDLDITVDEEYISRVRENLGDTLATRYIDYTRIKEMAQRAREYRLIPEYTAEFFKRTLIKADGKYKERDGGFISIESVPLELRRLAEEDAFRRGFGVLLKRYPKVTFDKDIASRFADAEFVSFGHPLFEAALAWCEKELISTLSSGATFLDPDGVRDGYILFYEGEIRDGAGSVAGKRLFAFYTDGKSVSPVSPAIIWDLADSKDISCISVDIDQVKSLVSANAISALEDYRKELLSERERQVSVKEKYGIRSLDHLIVRLDGDLIDLQRRRDFGENVDLVMRNKEDSKDRYTRALEDLKVHLIREKSLTMSMPRFLGIIRVCPPPVKRGDKSMESDPEIEKIGMDVAMAYERGQGRQPEDVCVENLGFDIRSVDSKGGIRYIEVKARAGTGSVALTQNEWFKATRFKQEYYLYAVMNASSLPELYIINNPAENLMPEQKVEVVRYIVPFGQIGSKGEKSGKRPPFY